MSNLLATRKTVKHVREGVPFVIAGQAHRMCYTCTVKIAQQTARDRDANGRKEQFPKKGDASNASLPQTKTKALLSRPFSQVRAQAPYAVTNAAKNNHSPAVHILPIASIYSLLVFCYTYSPYSLTSSSHSQQKGSIPIFWRQ